MVSFYSIVTKSWYYSLHIFFRWEHVFPNIVQCSSSFILRLVSCSLHYLYYLIFCCTTCNGFEERSLWFIAFYFLQYYLDVPIRRYNFVFQNIIKLLSYFPFFLLSEIKLPGLSWSQDHLVLGRLFPSIVGRDRCSKYLFWRVRFWVPFSLPIFPVHGNLMHNWCLECLAAFAGSRSLYLVTNYWLITSLIGVCL